ncbi:P-loop ATPase, Sll1717 family [Enterococcus gallinarum]|uniref:P-loop ATPase, Sll1717 family n=2 Tax=Bacteria TaxID=2 RepID=UPI001D17BC62|nr:hypothetical protein [Enterococcus gallinarum]MCC4044821.1 hypothetical protein [Enterococcus gallinarum]
MVEVKFNQLHKGFIDGESESLYNRLNFENAFYDINGVLTELQNIACPTAILIGRKGVGKSAYGAKINLMENINSFTINLGEVSYNTFTKISDNKGNVVGTQRYLHAWYLLLISSIIKILDVDDVENELALKELKNIYNGLGLTAGNSIITDILIASKKEFKVKITGLEFSLGHDGSAHTFKVSNLTDLTNYIVDKFTVLGIKRTVLPVIDGVDDILRTKKEIREILSGLVRAIHSLNQKNIRNANQVKFILVIREDIVKDISDPDMNKIIQDTGHKLDWYGSNDLLLLINKRFLLTPLLHQIYTDEFSLWRNFFPSTINNTDSWNYFLEHTMYRPRDIVQFLNQFIKAHPQKTSVKIIDFKNELRKFSQDYFFEEMKNELLGFLNDDVIESLFQVFQKIGSERFNFKKFSDIYRELYPKYTPEDIRSILNNLFNAGYIGMVRNVYDRRLKKNKNYINFKHKDPRLVIDYGKDFIIHKGLYSALNI